jgi:hypothetical protein
VRVGGSKYDGRAARAPRRRPRGEGLYGSAGGGEDIGLALACAVVGIAVVDGISIELPGLMFCALAYYVSPASRGRAGRILGIAAAGLNVVSIVVSGVLELPQ